MHVCERSRIKAPCPECGAVRTIFSSDLYEPLECARCGTVFFVGREQVSARTPRSNYLEELSNGTPGPDRGALGRTVVTIVVITVLLILAVLVYEHRDSIWKEPPEQDAPPHTVAPGGAPNPK